MCLLFFFLLCNILRVLEHFDKVSPNFIMLNSGTVKFSFLLALLDFVWDVFGFLRDFLCVALHNMLAILEKSD